MARSYPQWDCGQTVEAAELAQPRCSCSVPAAGPPTAVNYYQKTHTVLYGRRRRTLNVFSREHWKSNTSCILLTLDGMKLRQQQQQQQYQLHSVDLAATTRVRCRFTTVRASAFSLWICRSSRTCFSRICRVWTTQFAARPPTTQQDSFHSAPSILKKKYVIAMATERGSTVTSAVWRSWEYVIGLERFIGCGNWLL